MSSPLIISDLIKIFKSCVSAVNPQILIRKSLQYSAQLQILNILGNAINVKNRNIYMVGAGKAVYYMAKETESILGNKLKKGIISVPAGSIQKNLSNGNIQYFEGAKDNLPDTNAENTANIIKQLALSLSIDDILLVLISGGGSALLPLPKQGLSLEDKLSLIKQLANAGADIVQINTVRKSISDIKGGKLAMYAHPAQVITFILSDIVGDPIDLIASGPTCQNNDSPIQSIEILKKYNLYDNISNDLKNMFNIEFNCSLQFPLNNIENYCIGSNKISLDAAEQVALELGYVPIKVSNTITGNVKGIAKEYLNLTAIVCNLMCRDTNKIIVKEETLKTINLPIVTTDWIDNISYYKNICLILGGETTVELKGHGKGGRNQQLALEFSKNLHIAKKSLEPFQISFLSAGTDGIDGPTDAAGAIGYNNLFKDAKEDNLSVDDYIKENDSYNFYKRFKNGAYHVKTGHTNTNVMDIHLIIINKV